MSLSYAPVSAAHGSPDPVGGKIGMWLFLFTEMLLFGGLFLLYSVYRATHPEGFHRGAAELDLFFGTLNTVVLLTSSLTMASSITALRRGNRTLSATLLGVTIFCAGVFLVNKYIEWGGKIHHGIFPGSEILHQRPPGEILFFGLYYAMTGLHGLHVIIGGGLLIVVLVWMLRGRVTADHDAWLENSGLYWHLVDVVWIFLFPLLYLIT